MTRPADAEASTRAAQVARGALSPFVETDQ
jgi:hypothetical protein